MSKQVTRVDTLFLHQTGDDYLVVARRDGKRVLRGKLELKETNAGPRPLRFLVTRKGDDSPRDPSQFVELARSAARIRISQQTPKDGRDELKEMLDGYQLEALTVRTCRRCAVNGRYSPITDDTAIKAEHEHICRDCAVQELEGELSFAGGLTQAAQERLEELLYETGDLTRITNLLQGELDPDLTKFDTISATTEDVELVETSTLDLHPNLKSMLTERFDTLLPVQSLAIDNGLLDGDDQLVVSATATGKTLVGELAGINRMLNDDGKMLFLVPLVALANQKHEDFKERYGHLGKVTIRVGASRINDDGNRFDPNADVIVGTYEGIDHALRTGKDLGDIGTVVIDEVHTLKEEERGHRLDGMIARLKHYCEARAKRRESYGGAQWIYLSATVGNPKWLAQNLRANLVEYEDRPVPIERHVTFADGQEKPRIENRLVRQAFDSKSSKGYRGQTIIFTNSRRRCHEIARKMDYNAAAYHAGLDYGQRKRVERQFANQDLAAVVTTAALAAGVDFPASQVIFDTLAMGIEWLSVQEFSQMLGRAGRPDYHDKGVVYLLVEPDASYHNTMEMTEDEVAFKLLKGEMEEVRTVYDQSSAVEETLANIVVAGKKAKALNSRMLGEVPTTHAVGKLLEWGFIDGLDPTPLGLAVTRQFLSPREAFAILDGIRKGSSPYEIVADLELDEEGR
ncbi:MULTISPECIES: DEAD/DEAH box helicase [Haloferax]|uniref:Archaea-specific helicase AshA n=2 Tax=Haloferax gibbonsii TaxID=35746 RepID=A0A0K1IPG0_HALGI|nr:MULTISPECIES: DEAD/DEAH box helicase [Haloferax]AKU06437.1 DEAD/DEAH box helicase [Haloferax gibbonsii]ELZ83882.1 helicase AshA [Haloferax gibbonsii ATCC 33959]QOS10432.1 archaea-specific helicase AshA [Haloferax gibbonsii]RDZ54265.1 DEAD/DEAH box helicase [Haloferax sp. Atlit-4N]REA06079.1 DEAD/DEAH box helicase [Haloferax sp. Atlit-6N]